MNFSGQALLVTDARNKSLLPLVITGLRSCCRVTEIILVSPHKDLADLRSVADGFPEATFLPDSEVLEFGVQKVADRSIPLFPQRAGWFYQQFLKVGFALHRQAKENYLVWDADTIPLRQMEFCADGKAVFTQGLEYFHEYFETIQDLLGFKSVIPSSVISQHALFNREVIQEMAALIARKRRSGSFAEAVLDSCEERQSVFFSEYETYAAFFSHFQPNEYRVRRRRWFRNAASIAGIPPSDLWLSLLARSFDFASFETWDVGPSRTVKGVIKLIWAMMLPNACGLYLRSKYRRRT